MSGTSTPFSAMLSAKRSISSPSLTWKGWPGNGSMAASGMSDTPPIAEPSRSPCEVNRSSTPGRVMGTFFLATAKHLLRKALERAGHLPTFVVGEDARAHRRRLGS